MISVRVIKHLKQRRHFGRKLTVSHKMRLTVTRFWSLLFRPTECFCSEKKNPRVCVWVFFFFFPRHCGCGKANSLCFGSVQVSLFYCFGFCFSGDACWKEAESLDSSRHGGFWLGDRLNGLFLMRPRANYVYKYFVYSRRGRAAQFRGREKELCVCVCVCVCVCEGHTVSTLFGFWGEVGAVWPLPPIWCSARKYRLGKAWCMVMPRELQLVQVDRAVTVPCGRRLLPCVCTCVWRGRKSVHEKYVAFSLQTLSLLSTSVDLTTYLWT